MRKINQLVVKSIQHYHKFLSSFELLNTKEKNPGAKLNEPIPFDKLRMFELPKRIEESADMDGYLQAIVTSYLSIGRLYIKIVTSVPQDRVRYWIECDKYYRALKEYLDRNQDQKQAYFEEYYTKLEEMLALIPGKIQHIIGQSVF